jgi:hypothetical protein
MAKRYVLIDDTESDAEETTLELGPTYLTGSVPSVGRTLINDFYQEMTQSVTIQLVTASGLYGPTFGAASTYYAYVKQTIKDIIDKTGKAAVSSCQIYLDGFAAIDYDSKLTYASKNPPILKIQKIFDEVGGQYATVIFT